MVTAGNKNLIYTSQKRCFTTALFRRNLTQETCAMAESGSGFFIT